MSTFSNYFKSAPNIVFNTLSEIYTLYLVWYCYDSDLKVVLIILFWITEILSEKIRKKSQKQLGFCLSKIRIKKKLDPALHICLHFNAV